MPLDVGIPHLAKIVAIDLYDFGRPGRIKSRRFPRGVTRHEPAAELQWISPKRLQKIAVPGLVAVSPETAGDEVERAGLCPPRSGSPRPGPDFCGAREQ